MSDVAAIRGHLRHGDRAVGLDTPRGPVELTSVSVRSARLFDTTGGIPIDGQFVATDNIYYGKGHEKHDKKRV